MCASARMWMYHKIDAYAYVWYNSTYNDDCTHECSNVRKSMKRLSINFIWLLYDCKYVCLHNRFSFYNIVVHTKYIYIYMGKPAKSDTQQIQWRKNKRTKTLNEYVTSLLTLSVFIYLLIWISRQFSFLWTIIEL